MKLKLTTDKFTRNRMESDPHFVPRKFADCILQLLSPQPPLRYWRYWLMREPGEPARLAGCAVKGVGNVQPTEQTTAGSATCGSQRRHSNSHKAAYSMWLYFLRFILDKVVMTATFTSVIMPRHHFSKPPSYYSSVNGLLDTFPQNLSTISQLP
jgi:hypothetical protein